MASVVRNKLDDISSMKSVNQNSADQKIPNFTHSTCLYKKFCLVCRPGNITLHCITLPDLFFST